MKIHSAILFTNLLLSFAFFHCTPIFANLTPHSKVCENLIIAGPGARAKGPLDRAKRWKNALNSISPDKIETMEVIPTNSIDSLIIKAKMLKWASDYEESPNALMGDPRRILLPLGDLDAAFLGFRMESNSQLRIPSTSFFQQQINRINVFLPANEQIELSFYSVSGIVQTEPFLNEFIDHGALPVATSGATLIHDVSFHLPAIFIPPKEILLCRAQSRALRDFRDYVRTHDPDLFLTPTVQKMFTVQMKRQVAAIDLGTGNFSATLQDLEADEIDSRIVDAHLALTWGGISPLVYLQEFIHGIESLRRGRLKGEPSTFSNIDDSVETKLSNLLELFVKEKKSDAIADAGLNLNINNGTPRDTMFLNTNHSVFKQIKRIRAALRLARIHSSRQGI